MRSEYAGLAVHEHLVQPDKGAARDVSSRTSIPPRRLETNAEALTKAVALLLGLLVGTLGIVAVLMWADVRQARDDGSAAAASAPAATQDHATDPQHRAA